MKDGLAEWTEGNTAYLSVVFTWKVPKAVEIAKYYRSIGLRVVAGGPALFTKKVRALLEPFAEILDRYPDAIARHNPNATFASRGCPVGCWFCIVPPIEGREFTLIPDFPVRTVLCDNNLSALPIDYQKHIVARYQQECVPLLDANSGFEPKTFNDEVLSIWQPINRGPWRFAYDETGERDDVLRVLRMLRSYPSKRKRVYVLIGNEPFDACMVRIQEVIDHGGEPHVQPVMKLNALVKEPWVRHDWTDRKLRDVARWANGWVWRRVPFSDYDRTLRTKPRQTASGAIGLSLN